MEFVNVIMCIMVIYAQFDGLWQGNVICALYDVIMWLVAQIVICAPYDENM